MLLGPNGAGKTTLFALATRLYHGRSGTIRVFGADIRRGSEALARMGVVFQQPTLDLDLTVMQNMAYHAALHGMSRGRRRADRPRWSGRDRRPAPHRARAALRWPAAARGTSAGAAAQPGLLLLDEPTVGLDIESRHFLLDHVRPLCAERGLACCGRRT